MSLKENMHSKGISTPAIVVVILAAAVIIGGAIYLSSPPGGEVEGKKISLASKSVDYGEDVTVSGTGFSGNSEVTLLIGGNNFKTITTDSDGNFETTISTTSMEKGTHVIETNPASSKVSLKIKPFKVALILPGRIDDLSWNQAAYSAYDAISSKYENIAKFDWVEGLYAAADAKPAIRDYASKGYDLIIGHGFQYQHPVMDLASDYPNVDFAIGTGYKKGNNVSDYDVKLEEGGYVMGVLAGLMTETDKIAALGGVNVAEISRGHRAFEAGAKEVNPDVEVTHLFTGDWTDAAKAKTLAAGAFDSGVDIIWCSGDGITLGVNRAGIEARAEGKNVYVLQNEFDQNKVAPNLILSSVVHNWKPVFKEMINDSIAGEFGNGEYWAALEGNGIEIAPYHGLENKVPEDVKAEVNQTIEGIKQGVIEPGKIIENITIE